MLSQSAIFVILPFHYQDVSMLDLTVSRTINAVPVLFVTEEYVRWKGEPLRLHRHLLP